MMKPSLFIATPEFPPDSKFVHLYRDTVDKNIKRAADQGFPAVEFLINDPDECDVDLLEESIKENGIELACLNTGYLASVLKYTMISEDKQIMEKAMQKLKKCIDIAQRMHCFVGIGLFRGACIPDKPVRYSKDLLVDALREAAAYAKERDVDLSFEPTNRFEINFINSTAEGVEIVERVGYDNLGMTLDLFHIYLEDRNMYESIVMAKDHVKHMHFSDSDRWPAGFSHGEINFPALIQLLHAIGYDGYLSEGLVRAENADECARVTARYLKDLIQKYTI
ncbi:sugar phosphate isomerase/epimerase family protein [Clostridium sp. AM58-1XD]|uniref:sugar phosphate isomerase/epimerase family protein n=1 Tax=Clostridium sp. AM58-1XD TaxID=2292307 RepID=UPI000E53C1F0|nr:sugar phosphate isomerase/epimerase family protein [Clostridium sp. AM58-1XD]RGY99252.1 sugar phosphate isomerase/epimerase [Clostridium sp. AM58-1XD]